MPSELSDDEILDILMRADPPPDEDISIPYLPDPESIPRPIPPIPQVPKHEPEHNQPAETIPVAQTVHARTEDDSRVACAISAAKALGVPIKRARELARQCPDKSDSGIIAAYILRNYR